MRRFILLTALLILLGGGASYVLSQGPTITPNIGLQIPGYQQQNWQVPLDFDLNQLDLFLSGNLTIPAIAPAVYKTATNCLLGGASGTTSPATCGSAASGMLAVPASQTSYTVNTTAVDANSEIIIQQLTDNSALPSSPTCNSGATNPIQSARSVGASFTFTLNSVASVTCVKYWIVN